MSRPRPAPRRPAGSLSLRPRIPNLPRRAAAGEDLTQRETPHFSFSVLKTQMAPRERSSTGPLAGGAAMAPLGWEEAAELARDGSEERLSRLKRSESVLARYRERRGEIGEVWASTSDYVLARYFGAAASAALGDLADQIGLGGVGRWCLWVRD